MNDVQLPEPEAIDLLLEAMPHPFAPSCPGAVERFPAPLLIYPDYRHRGNI